MGENHGNTNIDLPARSLTKGITSLYVLQAINYVFPLITIPYLTRVLGIEAFGITQVAIAFAAIGSLFADWGFNYTGTQAVARSAKTGPALSKIASDTISAKLLLCALWCAGVLIWAQAAGEDLPNYYLLALLITLSTTLTPTWLYQGLELFQEISRANAVIRVLTTILIFAMVREPDDITLVILLTALHGFLVAAWLWTRILYRGLRLHFPELSAIRATVRDGLEVFFTTALTSSYTTGAVLAVAAIGGNEAAGAYAAVERIISACKATMGPVVQVLYARISSYRQISRAQYMDVTFWPFSILFAFICAATFLIIAGSPYFFDELMKIPFEQIRLVLPALALTLPTLALAHWFVTVGLLARGKRTEWMIVILCGPAVGLLSGGALIGHAVAQDVVAVAVSATELTILMIGYFVWRKSWR
ncbi:MAG: oligosaccharide flippase family protein [Parvibaculum sp.]|uniref:oligosaccharide flippase family protein n=1 Tax=Parvibaculum sp. TaxID=2024848 RepID=UPI003C763E8A